MNKSIIFIDFDGTLSNGVFWNSLDSESFLKIQNYLFGHDKTILHGWMVGKYNYKQVC